MFFAQKGELWWGKTGASEVLTVPSRWKNKNVESTDMSVSDNGVYTHMMASLILQIDAKPLGLGTTSLDKPHRNSEQVNAHLFFQDAARIDLHP